VARSAGHLEARFPNNFYITNGKRVQVPGV
jgi:hypothetical protein